MTRFYMDLRFRANGQESAEHLGDELEEIIEHLADLDGVIDPDLSATLSTGQVTFSLAVDAEDEGRALREGLTLTRTAIHACEGGTPGWDGLLDEVEQTIRRGDQSGDLTSA